MLIVMLEDRPDHAERISCHLRRELPNVQIEVISNSDEWFSDARQPTILRADGYIIDLLIPGPNADLPSWSGYHCLDSLIKTPGFESKWAIVASILDSANADFDRAKFPKNVYFQQKAPGGDWSHIARMASGLQSTKTQSPIGVKTRVFLAHGRNLSARDIVEHALMKMGIDPVILCEQVEMGVSILESLRAHAFLAYAIILMTPDDFGRLRQKGEGLRPRARQNVVFELGFFIGALGPDRVCVLKDRTVVLPSNYDGVRYIDFNSGSDQWKHELVRALVRAGIRVDPQYGH